MNIHIKAVLHTIGIIGTGVISGFVMSYLPNWAVAVVALAVLSYLVYLLALGQLKYEQAIDEMNEKYQK